MPISRTPYAKQALEYARLNADFDTLVSFVNTLESRINAIVSPPPATGYATTAQLNAHQAAAVPHADLLTWEEGTIPAASKAVARVLTGTIGGGGTVTVAITPAFAGILFVHPCATSGTTGVAITAQSASSVTVAGTAGQTFKLLAIGY